MIQINEDMTRIKFVHMDYPMLSVGFLDVPSKQFMYSYGLFSGKYSFAELKEEFITYAFGDTMGNGIIRLVKALNDGRTLGSDLIKELDVREDDRIIEEIE
jgi:hypothetical protein